MDKLPILYDEILIPPSVLKELSHRGAPQEVQDWVRLLPGWVILREVHLIDATLPLHLGLGEREAISLALELHSNLLLIDDLPGCHAAEERGLGVMGTLTILMQMAVLSGFDFEEKLTELAQLGFRASDNVLNRIRKSYRR